MASYKDQPLTIVVVGASGDLAAKKIFPALFALYCQDFLPKDFHIFGYARSEYTHAAFREKIALRLTCRYTPGERECAQRMDEFLERCFYVSGRYESRDAMLDLYVAMQEVEHGGPTNRMFYLAIPPSIFMDVARAIGGAGLVQCEAREAWSRAVIEKPFGKDTESSKALTREIDKVFAEYQTFRIDHYLGKEVIQNLLVLRFANLIFEPIWNRQYIENVQISWQEDLGIEGRGGYFDEYGIVRDVMQNHLLQILSLVAMEPPTKLDGQDVRNEKVKVLRAIPPLTLDDIVIGQYTAGTRSGKPVPGYVEEDGVPNDSLTPTYGAASLRIENRRWSGVPFLVRAGKGLSGKMTEIRIQFRDVPGNMFCDLGGRPEANTLVIRVQPDESIYLKVINKVPGVDLAMESRNLDLRYKSAFSQPIPDAYEDLLLDVLRGEKGLFIRSDELDAAWKIFTPVLHRIEEDHMRPEAYPFGSVGPERAAALAARYGVQWDS